MTMLGRKIITNVKCVADAFTKKSDVPLLSLKSIKSQNAAQISTSEPVCAVRGCRRLEYLKRREHVYPIVPPKLTTRFQDYYTPKVTYRKAKRTRSPSPKPHVFREPIRTHNLREFPSEEEAREYHDQIQTNVAERVNEQLKESKEGRLFAVIYSMGKQYLVKSEDVIVVRGHFPPELGETIRFEKVLLVGGRDFSLIGRPLLPRDQVAVSGTVVEKTFSNPKYTLTAERRCRKRTWAFDREPLVYVRINSVCVLNEVDRLPDVRGVDGKVFGNMQ